LEGFGLALAELSQEPAVRAEEAAADRLQAAIVVEAVEAAEEGFWGLPVADFALEAGLVDGGDVRGIGDDSAETGSGEGSG